jgi:hypothetical protein
MGAVHEEDDIELVDPEDACLTVASEAMAEPCASFRGAFPSFFFSSGGAGVGEGGGSGGAILLMAVAVALGGVAFAGRVAVAGGGGPIGLGAGVGVGAAVGAGFTVPVDIALALSAAARMAEAASVATCLRARSSLVASSAFNCFHPDGGGGDGAEVGGGVLASVAAAESFGPSFGLRPNAMALARSRALMALVGVVGRRS